MRTARVRGGGARSAERQKLLRHDGFGETPPEHLVNLWGADHVVIGTDYPYDMGYHKPVEFVEGAKLTRAPKDQIMGGMRRNCCACNERSDG